MPLDLHKPTAMADQDTTGTAVVMAGALADTLAAVIRITEAANRDLPILRAAQFTVTDGTLTVHATDQHRLLRARMASTHSHRPSGTIPTEALGIARNMLGPVSEDRALDPVVVTFTTDTVTFTTDNDALTADLCPEDYPKVGSLLDAKQPHPIERIGFNPRYMLDLIEMPRAHDKPLVLEFTGEGAHPIHTEWETDRAEDARVHFHHGLMPMNPTHRPLR